VGENPKYDIEDKLDRPIILACCSDIIRIVIAHAYTNMIYIIYNSKW